MWWWFRDKLPSPCSKEKRRLVNVRIVKRRDKYIVQGEYNVFELLYEWEDIGSESTLKKARKLRDSILEDNWGFSKIIE